MHAPGVLLQFTLLFYLVSYSCWITAAGNINVDERIKVLDVEMQNFKISKQIEAINFYMHIWL